MVQNYKHLCFFNSLKNSILLFFEGSKLQTPLAKGAKLETPFWLKVQNYKHLSGSRYKITNTFLAKGTKLETPFRLKVQDYKHLFWLKVQNYKHLCRVAMDNTYINTIPLVRIDRNIVHNIDNLFDLFGIGGADMDDNLLRAIVYYLCFNYQNNLFSYEIFDPYEFAQQMGYSTVYLRSKHPKPLFVEDLNKKPEAERKAHLDGGYPTYETNIENALYALWKKEVMFSYGAKFYTSTEKEEVLSHQNIRLFILRNLQILEVRSGKTRQHRTVYSIEMDDRFVHSLTKYFIRSNKKTLIDLRKSKLDVLYLKLLQYKENGLLQLQGNPAKAQIQPNSITVELGNFEAMCRWAGVPLCKKDGSPVPSKARKQQLLDALRTVNEKTDLSYTISTATKRGQKFPYSFSVTFNLVPGATVSRHEEDRADMIRLFDETLSRDLFTFWRSCYCKDANPYRINMGDFSRWVSCDTDYEEKKNVYLVAMAKIFGKQKLGQKSYESHFQAWYMGIVRKSSSVKSLGNT
jgi:hypothetical protein